MERKLTLLAAPAGFGKTTVLSAWHASSTGRLVPLAWLALDAGDNDPVRFWTYVGAALDGLRTGVGAQVQALLQVPPVRMEAVVTVLLNALADLTQDAGLVLDDYHAITSGPLHRALAVLIEHLSPRLHLIMASRTDPPLPLARWRARGEMIELRAADLRFTTEETAAFLRARPGLSLTTEEISLLDQRTEGWIAGLHLAALSLQGRHDSSHALTAITGSHRYVGDYLVEEVLARQAAGVQTFLLQTAILDRLCGPLCDAITGRSDGQALLEQLETANLFLIPLDEERQWYRYHHLFADVLRHRLERVEPGGSAALQRRAAAWYEQAGLLPEAIGHALAATEVAWAARLVEQAADQLWMRGELVTLLSWLDALPADVVRARPFLFLAHAWVQFLAHSYDPAAAEALLTDAETVLGVAAAHAAEHEQAALWGRLAAIRAAVSSVRDDIPRTIALAQEALARLPEGSAIWRVVATLSLGLAFEGRGDAAAASRRLAETIALSRTAGTRYLALVATMNLARVRIAQGQLQTAADLCRQGLDLGAEQGGGRLPVTGALQVTLGLLRYEWNDLEAATGHLWEGIRRVQQADEHLRVLLDGYAALARVKQVQGDASGAHELMRRAQQVADATDFAWAAPLVATYRARLALSLGRLGDAVRRMDEVGLRLDGELAYQHEFAHLSLVRVLIAQGKTAEALQPLERLQQAAEAAGRWRCVTEILLLRALAYQAHVTAGLALPPLAHALVLAEPEGYIRLFVDEGAPMAALLAQLRAELRRERGEAQPHVSRTYLDTLLTAYRAPHARAAPTVPLAGSGTAAPLPEPLTAREREVLQLIAAGLSNPEIAARLVITVGTVKTYVNTIFSKLAVTSRTQAVAQARALHLLAD
jgi:LuxR family maltose regulon positive regulatory protein